MRRWIIETIKYKHETEFFDIRLGINARINPEFMIEYIYKMLSF